LEEKKSYNPALLLCESCGNQILKDYWKCPKCSAHFCFECGKAFQEFLKNLIPYCPACNLELLSERLFESLSPPAAEIKPEIRIFASRTPEIKFKPVDLNELKGIVKNPVRDKEVQFKRPISEEQKILNYLKTTRIRRIRNKQDLLNRLCNLFRKEPDYVNKVWLALERKYPGLIIRYTSQFKDELLKRQREHANYEALHKSKDNTKVIIPEFTQKSENLDLKNVKQLDGIEYKWKEGRMKAVEQKTYRSKFDEQ
jgi:hypothetical protein